MSQEEEVMNHSEGRASVARGPDTSRPLVHNAFGSLGFLAKIWTSAFTYVCSVFLYLPCAMTGCFLFVVGVLLWLLAIFVLIGITLSAFAYLKDVDLSEMFVMPVEGLMYVGYMFVSPEGQWVELVNNQTIIEKSAGEWNMDLTRVTDNFFENHNANASCLIFDQALYALAYFPSTIVAHRFAKLMMHGHNLDLVETRSPSSLLPTWGLNVPFLEDANEAVLKEQSEKHLMHNSVVLDAKEREELTEAFGLQTKSGEHGSIGSYSNEDPGANYKNVGNDVLSVYEKELQMEWFVRALHHKVFLYMASAFVSGGGYFKKMREFVNFNMFEYSQSANVVVGWLSSLGHVMDGQKKSKADEVCGNAKCTMNEYVTHLCSDSEYLTSFDGVVVDTQLPFHGEYDVYTKKEKLCSLMSMQPIHTVLYSHSQKEADLRKVREEQLADEKDQDQRKGTMKGKKHFVESVSSLSLSDRQQICRRWVEKPISQRSFKLFGEKLAGIASFVESMGIWFFSEQIVFAIISSVFFVIGRIWFMAAMEHSFYYIVYSSLFKGTLTSFSEPFKVLFSFKFLQWFIQVEIFRNFAFTFEGIVGPIVYSPYQQAIALASIGAFFDVINSLLQVIVTFRFFIEQSVSWDKLKQNNFINSVPELFRSAFLNNLPMLTFAMGLRFHANLNTSESRVLLDFVYYLVFSVFVAGGMKAFHIQRHKQQSGSM